MTLCNAAYNTIRSAPGSDAVNSGIETNLLNDLCYSTTAFEKNSADSAIETM